MKGSHPWSAGIVMAALVAASIDHVIAAGKTRILQTNAAGDNIHIIDPDTDRVVGMIEGIEVPHGVCLSPDGSRVYVTDESQRAVAVVDGKSLRVITRIPLTGRPNNIAVSKDGRRVYASRAVSPRSQGRTAAGPATPAGRLARKAAGEQWGCVRRSTPLHGGEAATPARTSRRG